MAARSAATTTETHRRAPLYLRWPRGPPRRRHSCGAEAGAREIITVLAHQGRAAAIIAVRLKEARAVSPNDQEAPIYAEAAATAAGDREEGYSDGVPRRRRTNCAYWERVAAARCEIMDTLTEDKGKVLRKRLRDCCRKLRKTKGGILALDAGCGAGKWLPFLGSLVDDLLAIDCSQKLVERAKRVYGSPGRVTATGRPRAPCRFGVVDLTKDEPGKSNATT